VSEQDAFKDGREQGRRDCAAEIERLRNGEMWCSACGSIVSDGQCDCTRMETGPGCHVLLRDYLTAEIERLRAALQRIDDESNCDRAAQIAQEALELRAVSKVCRDFPSVKGMTNV
jgi:hypothetical protein